MSRGVADNSDPDDANINSQSGPITPQGLPNGSVQGPSPSTDAPPHDETTTATNGDNNTQHADELREQSPGPHLHEMTNGSENEVEFLEIEGMDKFIRINGDEGGSGQSTDSAESNETFDPDLRRVKVYELVGSRWTDRGTAFCAGDFDNDLEEARLVAKSESSQEILLNCLIRATDVYQRQQETLIVWTEPDGTDFALSFQDIEGCSEVWDFICEVQKHLVNRVPSTAAQIIQSGHLPPPSPDAAFIAEIEKAMRTMARSPKSRETICQYIQDNKYIYQLLDVFEAAEKTESIEALHALCSCMQTILLLNEHTMYEHILNDELWMGVVGILEYDPEFPKFKANYREFLLQRSHFMQPIVIQNEAIQRKIHATYRLQYLKDVILGRALDDSTFNVLNSCIIFNQIDIINHVQHDEHFLTELVSLFIRPVAGKGKAKEKDADSSMDVDKPVVNGFVSSSAGSSSQPSQSDESMEVDRQKEVIALLQQLCVMGKNVQLPTRIGLFRTLVEQGVLYAVQWALNRPEKHIVFTAGEILAVLLDHHTLSVRNHILSQAVALGQPTGSSTENPVKLEHSNIQDILKVSPPPFKETLSQVISRMLANSQELALQTQFADAVRLLTDVPYMEPPAPELQANVGPGLLNRPMRDDHSTERFLDNFYKVCVETLLRPLTHDVPDHHELKNSSFMPSRERGNLYLYLCDLLCGFAIQHSFRSYFLIVSSNVVSRIASLLSVRDKHLCLAALRFFRICLKMNNRNLFTHMHKHECFTPISNLAVREAMRENLLSSTCQEFFEFMRKENLRDPINHIMEKHEAEIRELAKSALGSATFHGFVARWEINKEPLPVEPDKRQSIMIPRMFGQRVMDSEEDDAYFNGDENDDDPVVPVPRVDSLFGLFRHKRQRISTPGPHAQLNKKPQRQMSVPSQQHRPVSPLSSLLEYDDDDDASPDADRPDKESPTPDNQVFPPREIELLPYEPGEPPDPEDDLLESLVSKEADDQHLPALAGSAPSRIREKRRRGSEEEDDAFERLAPKNRRLSNASEDASQAAAAKVRASTAKASEDGPKKLKLRFGNSKSMMEAKPPSAPPRPDSKDGGNG